VPIRLSTKFPNPPRYIGLFLTYGELESRNDPEVPPRKSENSRLELYKNYTAKSVCVVRPFHFEEKGIYLSWFARSFQTNYKFTTSINLLCAHCAPRKRCDCALKLLHAFVQHQLVHKPSGNIFVRLLLCRFKSLKTTGNSAIIEDLKKTRFWTVSRN
jgi:hypothetical protein